MTYVSALSWILATRDMDSLSVSETRHRSRSYGGIVDIERDRGQLRDDEGASSTSTINKEPEERPVGRERSYSQSLRPDLLRVLEAKSRGPGQSVPSASRHRSYSHSPRPVQRTHLLQQRLNESSLDSDTEEGLCRARSMPEGDKRTTGYWDNKVLLDPPCMSDIRRGRSYSASTYQLPSYEPTMASFPSHTDEDDASQYGMRCRQQRTKLRRATGYRRISHVQKGPQSSSWGTEYVNFVIIICIIAVCFTFIRFISYLLW